MPKFKMFGMKMDANTRSQLEDLAQDYDGNMSLVLRLLVRRAHSERYQITDKGRAALAEENEKGSGR